MMFLSFSGWRDKEKSHYHRSDLDSSGINCFSNKQGNTCLIRKKTMEIIERKLLKKK